MSNKDTVERYLESEPKARERSNKNRAIVNLLITRYPWLANHSKEAIIDCITDAATLDRWWRKILEERADLRGSDYGKKEILEQEKELALGYAPGYHGHVKILRNIKN